MDDQNQHGNDLQQQDDAQATSTADQKPARKKRKHAVAPRQKPRSPIEVKVLTLPETAAVLKLGLTVTKGLVYSGRIRSVKVGVARRVPVAAVDEFLKGTGI
jgi:excisionase family DNA binding protein